MTQSLLQFKKQSIFDIIAFEIESSFRNLEGNYAVFANCNGHI